MSRIGRTPVAIPKGVTVSVSGGSVAVKGPKGDLSIDLRPEVSVSVEGDAVQVENTRPARDRSARAFHGMTRALIQNMVTGCAEGYERKLEINGVGYDVDLRGKSLVFNLGYANQVHYPLPDSVQVECPSRTQIIVRGADKQQVGLVASELRKLKPPEPYKGKGIKYHDEVIRRKAGKAFGSA